MTEAEWLACQDPQRMLEFLRGKVSDRKLRLFACGCWRSRPQLFDDERASDTLDVAERLADRLMNAKELARAKATSGKITAAHLSLSIGTLLSDDAMYSATNSVVYLRTLTVYAKRRSPRSKLPVPFLGLAVDAENCDLLRELIGPICYRSVQPNFPCHTATVTSLAESVYASRDFEQLPILADALEDQGCSSVELIGHLRSAGPHVRGCWALDLVLGKE